MNMHKIVIAMVAVLTFVAALPVTVSAKSTGTIKKTRIVQATKDTSLTYGGVKVFVPAGQTIVLGQTENGAIVVRGQNLQGVKIGDGTVSADGLVVLAVWPDTRVVSVSRGTGVKVTDANGRTAELSQGASVYMRDIRLPAVPTVQEITKPAAAVSNAPAAEVEGFQLPSFVADMETSSAASEQAVQNVEDTLSPSAPR